MSSFTQFFKAKTPIIKEEKLEESVEKSFDEISVKEIEAMVLQTDPSEELEMSSVDDECSYREGPHILKKIGGDSSEFKELMTEDQWQRFGDRKPNGFIKIAIMDIGKNSIVWLASNRFTGEKVALRQIPSYEEPLA